MSGEYQRIPDDERGNGLRSGSHTEHASSLKNKKDSKRYPDPSFATCLPFDAYPQLVLLCICLMTFGSYFVYDVPGAIPSQLCDWFGGPDKYSKSMNLNLYSVYGYPNIFLAFCGGIVIDSWLGIRKGTLLFCALIFLGQAIFAWAVYTRIYWLCLVGRFVFGLGGESLTVAQNAFTVRWFDGNLIALAFAVVLGFSRLGSSFNFIFTPMLADIGVDTAVWIGTATCLLSLLACILLIFLDWFGESRVKAEVVEEKMLLRHILEFPFASWVLFGICFFFYIAILTFYAVASDIMENTGAKYSPETASLFLAIPNFVAIAAFPPIGFLVDRYGRSLYWLIGASVMLLVAHAAFLINALEVWHEIHPVIIMVWLGFAYACGASAMWPMLAYILPKNVLATGYGTMTAVQNLGTAIAPQIIGKVQELHEIKDTRMQYVVPIIGFTACAGFAILLTCVLLVSDPRHTQGRLNSSAAEREALGDVLGYSMDLSDNEEDEDADAAAGLKRRRTRVADHKASLALPPMVVGTVFLRRTNQHVRGHFYSRLGLPPSPLLAPNGYYGASGAAGDAGDGYRGTAGEGEECQRAGGTGDEYP